MKIITVLLIFFLSFTVHSFPLPKENKAKVSLVDVSLSTEMELKVSSKLFLINFFK